MTPEERADKALTDWSKSGSGTTVLGLREKIADAIRGAAAEMHQRCLEAAEKVMRAQVHIEEEMGAEAVVNTIRALSEPPP